MPPLVFSDTHTDEQIDDLAEEPGGGRMPGREVGLEFLGTSDDGGDIFLVLDDAVNIGVEIAHHRLQFVVDVSPANLVPKLGE